MPTSVSWLTYWLKSPPRLLTWSPTIPFWNSIVGNSAWRAAACCRRCHIGRVDVDQADAQVGHRAVLGVEQVGGSSASRAACGRSPPPPVSSRRSSRNSSPGKSCRPGSPCRGADWAPDSDPSLEAPHRQTPRLAWEVSPGRVAQIPASRPRVWLPHPQGDSRYLRRTPPPRTDPNQQGRQPTGPTPDPPAPRGQPHSLTSQP